LRKEDQISMSGFLRHVRAFQFVVLLPVCAFGQLQNNGVVPIAAQPAGMPPAGKFSVTAVTYSAFPANSYPSRLVAVGGGKAIGYILPGGLAGNNVIYDPAAQTLTFSNQFFFSGGNGVQITAFDGADYAGVYNGGLCFWLTPAGFFVDSRTVSNTPFTTTILTNSVSACYGVDHGVAVGTAFNQIWTRSPLTGGESFSTLTGYSQTAFAGTTTLGTNGFTGSCCTRAHAIKDDQVVGDLTGYTGLPLPNDPLGVNTSFAANPRATAVLWSLSAPGTQVVLGPSPSSALATNGIQQGGWVGSHAAMWSGSSATFVDLNPPGYTDSRVTGMTLAFQAGDGWLGAVRHALVWQGSAAGVLDLNQFLPPDIQGASINAVDPQGNIVGSMITATGQEIGLYFKLDPTGALASFVLSSANPAPGDTVTGTVTLQAPAGPAGVTVTFTSSNGSVAPAPSTLVIPAGQTSASFNVTTNAAQFLSAPAPVTFIASAGFTALSASLNATAPIPADAVTSLLAPANVNTGDTVPVQVVLAGPAPAAGVEVNFASSNPAVLPAPPSVLIPAGASSASFSVAATAANQWQPVAVALSAQTGSVIQQATVTVASIPKPNSIQFGGPQGSFTTVASGASGFGFVAFSAVPQSAGVVAVTNSNPALVVPSSIPFTAGDYFPQFAFSTLPVSTTTTGNLTATLNGVTATALITVGASPSPTIQAFTIPLTSATQTWSTGQTLTATVTLSSRAYLGGMTLSLATDTPSAVQLPATVAIPALATSVTFPVTALAVAAPTNLTITATLPGVPSASVALTVIPGPALAMSTYTLAPFSMIGPGVVTNGTIAINQPAPAGGLTIALSASIAQPAKFPATVNIAAGQTSAAFTVQGNGVSAVTSLLLFASYKGPLAPLGTSATANLTVAPTDTLHVTSATWSKSTQTLTVNATSTNPAAVLTVLNASGNVPLGTMQPTATPGTYTFQTTLATIASVNLKSNLGGSTGQGVTVVP
jgi:hypothetical protein